MKAADRLDLLQTFVRIAEAGSLTAAAQSLGTTQPTVSRQLRQLEERLGARLLERTTQSQSLTENGRMLLADARALLAGWEDARERIARGEGEVEGLLRVIAPVALGQTLLVDAAARLAARHPALSFDWILTDEPADLTRVGADCIIRIGPIADETLVQRTIARARRVLVIAPHALPEGDPPQLPDQLAELPALVARPFYGAALELMGPDGTRTRVALAPRFVSDNIVAVHRAALRGLGFALLPAWLVTDDIAAGRLVRLLPDHEGDALAITLGYPSGRRITARLRAFVEALRGGIALR